MGELKFERQIFLSPKLQQRKLFHALTCFSNQVENLELQRGHPKSWSRDDWSKRQLAETHPGALRPTRG